MNKIAILYQALPPPIHNGIQKPMKLGGYADSGADIAYELLKNNFPLATPVDNPNINTDLDWVFPDTKDGIQTALEKGARIFWLNTLLYKKHPITLFYPKQIQIVGQLPSDVHYYDDKLITNEFLRKNKLPFPKTQQISINNLCNYELDLDFPMVLKPIRGRGSQGVKLVRNKSELNKKMTQLFSDKVYGTSVYVESFLGGQEITITVMPPGKYLLNNQETNLKYPWGLPAVRRYNHQNEIAPYSGLEAVLQNSQVLEDDELNSVAIQEVIRHCEKAAELLKIRAPIRIDCRANEDGKYFLFDVNMKPNMTGPSRPHRIKQDSLTLLAAKKIGWQYVDLLQNVITQSWSPEV